jgi:hypothetical protein
MGIEEDGQTMEIKSAFSKIIGENFTNLEEQTVIQGKVVLGSPTDKTRKDKL